MLGKLLIKARKEKHVMKSKLAKGADINLGHLTKLEKGDRSPTHKTLKKLCDVLKIPYFPMMNTYEKEITEEQMDCDIIKHLSYDRIPVVNIESFVQCPLSNPNASFCVKFGDDKNDVGFPSNSYGYVEFNTPLNHRDFGVFYFNGDILFRRFIIRDGYIILHSLKPKVKDIIIRNSDDFWIIGKIRK